MECIDESVWYLFLSLSTAAQFQSLPYWFHLPVRWRKRSRLSIDEVSKFEGALSKSVPEGKMSFLVGRSATSEKLTSDLSSRKDAIRCPRQGESRPCIGRPIALPRCPGTWETGRTGFQNGFNLSKEGLSGEPPDSHYVVVEQPVVEPKRENTG